MPYNRLSGNTISEYALPLSLVVLVMIAAINSSGMYNRLLGLFAGSTNNWSGPTGTGKVAPLGSPVLPMSAAMLMPPSEQGEEPMCFASGICMNVPTSRPDAAAGNGGEQVLTQAELLEKLADALKKIEGMEEISGIITDLANKGHTLGKSMNEIEQLCGAGVKCSGQNESNANRKYDEIFKNTPDRTSYLKQFEDKWHELEALLHDPKYAELLSRYPEARSIIESNVADIKDIVNGLKQHREEASRDETTNGVPNAPNHDAGDEYTTFSNLEDDEVHTDANTVCSQGGSSGCFRKNADGSWEPIQTSNDGMIADSPDVPTPQPPAQSPSTTSSSTPAPAPPASRVNANSTTSSPSTTSSSTPAPPPPPPETPKRTESLPSLQGALKSLLDFGELF